MTDLSALGRIVGEDDLITEPDPLYAHDRSPYALLARRRGDPVALPAAVVRPATTDEVAATVRWAIETHTSLVPFGGGSGVCRAIDAGGTVVVDTTRMNVIAELDEKSLLVRAGAGAYGEVLNEHLSELGYTIGHEPQSMSISTVGGWIATRACGQLSARFGGIEDLRNDFEAVLADGSRVRWKRAPRRSAGPDVAALLIGSEGTLGIVTEATLRRPGSRRRGPAVVSASSTCPTGWPRAGASRSPIYIRPWSGCSTRRTR